MDDTNAGTPAAGGQLSGEASRAAAVKRLAKQKMAQSSAPNTGASGIPKPEASIVQKPGLINQSSTPEKPRRI
jgi:hypothetical protein